MPTPLPSVSFRKLLGADGKPLPDPPTVEELLDEFEQAAIAYREYACGETYEQYREARSALREMLHD